MSDTPYTVMTTRKLMEIVFCENLPTLTEAAVSTMILSITAEKSCIHKSKWEINTFVHGWYSLALLGTNFSFIVGVGVS